MIIGISGKINSGKDTVGKIIQEQIILAKEPNKDTGILAPEGREFVSKWQIKKFADKLKDMVCLMIGCTREELKDETFKNTQLGEEWWYFKGRNGSLISYSKDSKRSAETSKMHLNFKKYQYARTKSKL